MAPNKTLAAQLYAEFKELFPDNAVEYFVSYYDYYQPEAYVPSTDTYIEKDSSINDEIDKLRHSATRSLLDAPRRDHRGERLVHLRPRRARALRRDARLPRAGPAVRARRAAAPARRHPVRAQRHRLPPRHVPRARRRGRGLPAVRGGARAADRVLRRRDREPRRDRSAARRGAGAPEEGDDLPGQPLRRDRRDAAARDRGDPRRAPGAARRVPRGGQAARGAAARAAHALRPRDARGDGLLPRHRELLALARRPRRGRAAVHALRLLPGRLPAGHRREPRQRAADRRDVPRRPRAQGDAGRVRLPAAVGARQPAAALRGVRGARAASASTSRRRRPTTSSSSRAAWSSSRSSGRPAWSIRRSRCGRRPARSTTCSARSARASRRASACSSRR